MTIRHTAAEGKHMVRVIRSFRYASGQITDHWDWSSKLAPLGAISSFGEDARGELYVVAHNGRVYRLVRQT